MGQFIILVLVLMIPKCSYGKPIFSIDCAPEPAKKCTGKIDGVDTNINKMWIPQLTLSFSVAIHPNHGYPSSSSQS